MAENSSPNVNRIFVGGLGANVTSNDLKNIFTSLGKVKNIEFVRTNGRDFAYVDFEPQSDKALHKLFSTYNGCKWKGGKLRLEKAKEHYLTRLKREWAQDSVPVPEPVQEVESLPVDPKLEKLNLDSMKINIFFPKLMKVKSLPYKGSGKHKYSFQRVELSSSLPLHFCDCELHCGSHASVNETYEKALESAAREKELSIMHSVFDKIMKENEERENEERENEERESHGREDEERESEEKGNYARGSEERESEERENEERESEDDGDMVMNILSSRSEELMLERVLKESLDSKKELQERNRKVSKAKIMEKQPQETYKNENEENEERESEEREEIEEEEELDGDLVINISSNKSYDLMLDSVLKETLDNKKELLERKPKFSKEKIIEKQNEEKEKVDERELDGDMIINISNNKSDELISEPIVEETLDNNKESHEEINELSQNQEQEASIIVEKEEEKEKSFPINVEKNTNGDELKEIETKIQKPNSNSSNTWFQKSAWRDLVGSSNTSLFSSSTSIQTLNSNLPKQANNSNEPLIEQKGSQITQQTQNPIVPKQVTNSNEESKKRKEITKEGENVNKKIKRVVQKVTVSEVCPFMRSEESEKEWIKTRNALKGYMKNNKKKSDGSNKMQGKRGNQ